MMLLTKEQIKEVVEANFYPLQMYKRHAAIAKAQVKKFVDIIKSDYPETLFLLEDLKFWHDLLEEVKE